MRGTLTGTLNADIIADVSEHGRIISAIDNYFKGCDISENDEHITFTKEEEFPYTYYRATRYEPEDYECDIWSTCQIKDVIRLIENDLNVDIEIDSLRIEERDN